jgi:transcriptional regulator with XRE-family HTH domain
MKAATSTEFEQRLRDVPGFEEGRRQRENILRLGEKIRELRETELGITQAEAARLVGMEQPELSRIENGIGKRGPSYLTITRIISAYRTNPTVQVALNISVSYDDSEEVAQSLLLTDD